MTPLAEALIRRIRLEGPITLADYMAAALTHPAHGYYMTRDPLGLAGDFITAPEVSQMFGELIGLWCAVVWQAMGEPAPFGLVELGPGRGTLMADALRATRGVPGFHAAARPRLVEVGPVFRSFQRRMVAEAGLADRATWHDDLSTVPDGPSLVVANEFLDALPIRQYRRGAEGWREVLVDIGADGESLRLVLSAPRSAPPPLPAALREAPDGSVAEVSPAALGLARLLGERLARDGGAALIIDYGHLESAPGDTFQAVRNHEFADPLAEPGLADLTAHVDFAAVAEAARGGGARTHGPIPQARLLDALGIRARGEALMARAGREGAEEIQSAYRRLVHPEEMGLLFKALGLSHPALDGLPGFEG